MGTSREEPQGVTDAVVHLRGHGSACASLAVERYSTSKWVSRVALRLVAWVSGSFAVLVLTFDPFVASFPFVIGAGYVHRAVKGRYHVLGFMGQCPRCSTSLEIPAGSKIPIPYPMVCYSCHHEPELRFAAAPARGAGLRNDRASAAPR